MFKVQELIHVINHEFSTKRRRKGIPAGFCYVCSQLDPRGRGGRGRRNPYRHLFAKGLHQPCRHFPRVPHPTFVSEDDDDDGFNDDSDEDSFELGDGSDDGTMFDTTIVREDEDIDPRLFKLPPVFGKNQETTEKRKSKQGRLVPMVSENTFLTTNKRGQGHDPDLQTTDIGDGLHLPKLSNQRASLAAAEEEGGQGGPEGRRRGKDPRRLHSERIDRRVAGGPGDQVTRSDSAIGLDLARSGTGFSREKTDPPPQPIVVSIRNQDGEVLQKIPLEDLPPGAIPSEAFAERREKPSRKKREKKRRPRSGTGSASPSFSGSISISRETTLSGFESPDFMSRLRSASWCECPEHARNESRCGECRKVIGHEKWCVSRNTICQSCGKAFKRKYSQLERKSSFGTMPASGMVISNVPTSESPSKNRHQNCSPTKVSVDSSSSRTRTENLVREASENRVRFHEDGKVVYPQWETFPDSGVEEDKDEDDKPRGSTHEADKSKKEVAEKNVKSYITSLDSNVHRVAYDLALADAKVKEMLQKKKKNSKNPQHPKGFYFSYFPLLKRRRPPLLSGLVSPTLPPETIGLRADSREGKRLKVKKGLKHILGDVKLEDYYPGGKHYPKPLSQRS